MSSTIAIIGGSGFYSAASLTKVSEHFTETPYGYPSAPILEAKCDEKRVLFLARHGLNHHLLPSEVPYRANIYALKELGATACLAINAAGSLKEEAAPGDFVIPDQVIDLTRLRHNTFFGEGVVAHCSLAEPFSEILCEALESCLTKAARVHRGGTYTCIEGPHFSSRAESEMYRLWGGHLIGMTLATEAKLCREAELPLASICMITDYDCWRENTSAVEANTILERLGAMAGLLDSKLFSITKALSEAAYEAAHPVLENSLVTPVSELSNKSLFPSRLLVSRLLGG
jgi:5'-methylthioadenosine phosphorylase